MKKLITPITTPKGKRKIVKVYLDDRTYALLQKYGDPKLIEEYATEEYNARNLERRENDHCVSLDAILEDGHGFESINGDPFHAVVHEDHRKIVDIALRSLTERQRAVFVAYVTESLSFTEIAEKLGLCRCRVWELYHAAVRRLQKFLDSPVGALCLKRYRQEEVS